MDLADLKRRAGIREAGFPHGLTFSRYSMKTGKTQSGLPFGDEHRVFNRQQALELINRWNTQMATSKFVYTLDA